MDKAINDCVMCGYMSKLESGFIGKKGWKKKFLRLYKDGSLWFYNDAKSSKTIGKRPLYVRGNKFWRKNMEGKKGTSLFCIKIECHPSNVFLSASNEETIITWTSQFKSVGGFGCTTEVILPDDPKDSHPLSLFPLLPLNKWTGETVQAWLDSTYFLDGQSFQTKLKGLFGFMEGRDLQSINYSILENCGDDISQKSPVLEKSDVNEIISHVESLKRRNIFNFGECVVLKKILDLVQHIPEESKKDLDFHLLTRALSDPDIMIETYLNLTIHDDSIHHFMKQGKIRSRKKPTMSGQFALVENKELKNIEKKVSRGDRMVIPIRFFVMEDIDFKEWNSVEKIFSHFATEVPLLPKKYSGKVKPALFFGPWMLTWGESGLCIPRFININSAPMFKSAIDLSVQHNEKKYSYKEVVTRLARVICSWNQRAVNIDRNGDSKIVDSLPNIGKKFLFHDQSTSSTGGGGGQGSSLFASVSSKSKSGLSESMDEVMFNSITSNSTTELVPSYNPGDSFKFVSEIFSAFSIGNGWKNIMEGMIGRSAGEFEMEFNPRALLSFWNGPLSDYFIPKKRREEWTVLFQDVLEMAENLKEQSEEPIIFETHKELDEFVHAISKKSVEWFQFPMMKDLLVMYDRFFWLRHMNYPHDKQCRPKREENCSVNVGCILNKPDFRTCGSSIIGGMVDFAEVIKWNNREEVEPLIKLDGLKLRFAQNDLFNDKSLVKIAIKQNARALKFASEKLQSDSELVKMAVQQDGLTIRYANKYFILNDRKNDSVFIAAVKQNGMALRYLSEKTRDKKKVVKHAVQQKGISIVYASERLKKEDDIALLAVKSDAVAYHHISERLKRTKNIVLEVVRNDYRFLVEHVEEGFKKDEDIIRVFLNGAIGNFSDVLFQDLQIEFRDQIVSKVYNARKNGELMIEEPANIFRSSFRSSDNIVYVGFSKNGKPEGLGFEMLITDIKKKKKRPKRGFSVNISHLGHGGSMYVTKDGGKMYETVFVGHYKNGLRDGRGMVYHNCMCIFEGIYKNGKRNGRGEYYDAKTGIVQRGTWKNDHLDEKDQDGFSYPIIKFSEVEKHLKGSNRVGVGAFGSVYVCNSSIFSSYFKLEEKKVAVKIMNTNPGLHHQMLVRTTKRGIGLICSIPDRENIMEIYGLIQGQREVGYVMLLCDISIDKLITKSKTSKIPIEEKIRILYETGLGMKSLHSRYVMHRDLKPANVMKGFDNVIKIADFDSSKEDEYQWRLQSMAHSTSVGTTGFMAPEIFKGNRYTLKSDIYAYAMMVYALLWGLNLPHKTQFSCPGCATPMKSIFLSNTLDYHVSHCNLRPLLDPKEVSKHPSFLIDLMIQCWNKKPFLRPSMEDICLRFELEEKKIFRTILLRFPKHKELVNDLKMFLTKPYKFVDIVEWIEKKFNDKTSVNGDEEYDQEEKEELEETEGEGEKVAVESQNNSYTKVLSLTHSIAGTIANDEDLNKIIEKEDCLCLSVELSSLNKSLVMMTAGKEDGSPTNQPNGGAASEENETLKKKLEEKDDEIERLKRLLFEKGSDNSNVL